MFIYISLILRSNNPVQFPKGQFDSVFIFTI